MLTLESKKIIVAITGSIAAYKSAFLVRQLIKKGAEVRVVMTPSATKFISPITLSTLSKHEVYIDVIDDHSWNNHVEMGLWADAMVVAPATANTLAKMANGICDTIVNAIYLSAKCPVFFAPAMDLDMWHHPSTQNNIQKLISYGNHYLEVGKGELASGLTGAGRMMEPEEVAIALESHFDKKKELADKKVLITAGPTYEHIDPVRFIGNPSSGKMGQALAQECADRGAQVTLVLGPSQVQIKHPNISVIKVKSANDMYEACASSYKNTDITIFSAAVADYTPIEVADQKIKKKDGDLAIKLKRTVDIAGTLGKLKEAHQLNIGFALETNNEENNALAKIQKKNFDLIVLNSLNDKGAGFGHDTNKVTLYDKNNKKETFSLKTKSLVAIDIVNAIVNLI